MNLLQKSKEVCDGEPVVYHGSTVDGLKQIKPHKCKHNDSFVYVSENIVLCVIFAVKRIGENISFGVGRFGKPYIDEFYDGGFEDRFRGKPCYIYKLPKSKFTRETEFIELVSREPVDVIECIEIKDSAEFLLSQAKKGKLRIGWFNKFSRNKKREMREKLKKTLVQYIDFKELTREQYDQLDEQLRRSYNSKKQRRDFCFDKFHDLIIELQNQK